MTKDELMALLRDPDQTGQSVNELNRLIEEYSYFHTGHQLYLQGLNKNNDTRLTHQLNKSALNVRDRNLLYNYINRPSAFRQQTTAPGDAPGETTVPFAPGNAFVSPEVSVPGVSGMPQLDDPTMLSGSGGIRRDTEEHTLAEEKIMSNDELLSIIQRQLNNIGGSTAPKDADTSGQTTEKAETDSAVVSTEQSAGTETVTQQSESEIKETNTTPVDLTTGGLIDAFLKANPRIIPSDSDYKVDLTESLSENENIATETLADIYAGQGHIQKAIEIYEHLILKYPEKHIYFAAQIDRLKQELI